MTNIRCPCTDKTLEPGTELFPFRVFLFALFPPLLFTFFFSVSLPSPYYLRKILTQDMFWDISSLPILDLIDSSRNELIKKADLWRGLSSA